MKKRYGIAAVLGLFAGAAYYMKKVGALTLTDEEKEDGSKEYALEVKLPGSAPERTAEPEETAEAAADAEPAEFEDIPEEQEDRQKKIAFSFTLGPRTRERLAGIKEKAGEMSRTAYEAVRELKDSIMLAAANRKGASPEEEEEPEDETYEEAGTAAPEYAEDGDIDLFGDRSPLERIDDYLEKAGETAEEARSDIDRIFEDLARETEDL